MNCECLTNIKAKLTDHVAERGVINPRLDAEFVGINLVTGEATISLVYTVRGDNRPYNTQKGKPLNMVASFCPFCGKSVSRTAAQAATDQKG